MKRTARFALSIVALCLLLLLLEAGAALGAHYVLGYARIHRFDTERGWAVLPNVLQSRSHDGSLYTIHTNALGLRSSHFELGTVSGRYRVLLLGDSFTFGDGVNVEDRFDRWLSVCDIDGKQIEVVNAGVMGYGTDQELAAFEAFAPLVAPDLVVLMTFENDLRDVLLDEHMGRAKPRYRVLPSGELERSTLELTPETWLRNHSYLYAMIEFRLRSYFHAPAPDSNEDGAALVRRLRSEIALRAHERGARLVSVLFSSRESIAAERFAWKGVLEDPGGADLVVDLDAAMRAAPDPDGLWFPHDPHWNAAGHRIAGAALMRALQSWYASLGISLSLAGDGGA